MADSKIKCAFVDLDASKYLDKVVYLANHEYTRPPALDSNGRSKAADEVPRNLEGLDLEEEASFAASPTSNIEQFCRFEEATVLIKLLSKDGETLRWASSPRLARYSPVLETTLYPSKGIHSLPNSDFQDQESAKWLQFDGTPSHCRATLNLLGAFHSTLFLASDDFVEAQTVKDFRSLVIVAQKLECLEYIRSFVYMWLQRNKEFIYARGSEDLLRVLKLAGYSFQDIDTQGISRDLTLSMSSPSHCGGYALRYPVGFVVSEQITVHRVSFAGIPQEFIGKSCQALYHFKF